MDVLDTVYRNGLIYSLIAYNWLTWAWETGYALTHKTVRAAINAHRGQEFVFLARNSCPWQRHTQEDELGVLRIQYPLVYNVNDCHFEFPVGQEGTNSFSSVVTAELVNSDETIQFDMSGFFHAVTWDSIGAPSLFEVVLTYCLENDLLFTLDKLRGFRLKVFTSDGEDVVVPLDSNLAQDDFVRWTAGADASPAPSATSAAEESKEDEDMAPQLESPPSEPTASETNETIAPAPTSSDSSAGDSSARGRALSTTPFGGGDSEQA